jgi:hypothetical protein
MRPWTARLVTLGLLVAIGYGIWAYRDALPDAWNPWAPLRIEDEPNLLTRMKLGRLADDPALCLATLAEAGFLYRSIPDRQTASGCRLDNAVAIERTSVAVDAPFILSCRSAVALALWERHVLHPAAASAFADPIVEWEHLGSYACRAVRGSDTGRLSRHATADAIDIAAFVLASKQRIAVDDHWSDKGAPGLFLREVRDGACGIFDSILSPDYNAAHHDHFHLALGPHRLCR